MMGPAGGSSGCLSLLAIWGAAVVSNPCSAAYYASSRVPDVFFPCLVLLPPSFATRLALPQFGVAHLDWALSCRARTQLFGVTHCLIPVDASLVCDVGWVLFCGLVVVFVLVSSVQISNHDQEDGWWL